MGSVSPTSQTARIQPGKSRRQRWKERAAEPAGRATVRRLLEQADIHLDGPRPWDIRVYNDRFYDRVLSGGSLALGESYMDGWWDCPALDQFFDRLLRADLDQKAGQPTLVWPVLTARIRNLGNRKRAFEIGRRHYDLGNDLFLAILDRWMNYSCGYWEGCDTLEQAQEAKLNLVCRKMELKPGMQVLDIGCGWGGFARYAAERFQVSVKGITVSRKQVEFSRRFCRGLPVEIELGDYRDLNARFDRIVSIGMFEHVGFRNYRTYMKKVLNCLKPEGIFLLQTIGGNRSVTTIDPWMGKYIFPNSMLPSAGQITAAAEDLLVLEDWHSFGPDYDRTLMAWHGNFNRAWDKLKDHYDTRFYRMWVYYLLSCAGSFRARRNQLWQIVFSNGGIRGGYRSRR